MDINDLRNYIYDKVVVYTEDPTGLNEWLDLYKGYLFNAPVKILNLQVKSIGGKKTGVVDIRVV